MSLHRTVIWPYTAKSESAKNLAEALDILRVKHEGSVLKGAPDLYVINFGSGGNHFPSFLKGSTIINDPMKILDVIDKTKFFTVAEGICGLRLPEWTTSQAKAKAWLNKGVCVLARQLTDGMAGAGIVIMEKPGDLVAAPLYTQYIEKDLEYRVYIVDGLAYAGAKKVKKSDETPKNWKIRTRDNGFVFQYLSLSDIPKDVIAQSKLAIEAVGLDFGGVDVVLGKADEKAYVLEVNSAPWMSEAIAEKLAPAFTKLLIKRGAKTKEQVAAAAPKVQLPVAAAPQPAEASTYGHLLTFQATFAFVGTSAWGGIMKGSTHQETVKATTWTAAVQKAESSAPAGWQLAELKAA